MGVGNWKIESRSQEFKYGKERGHYSKLPLNYDNPYFVHSRRGSRSALLQPTLKENERSLYPGVLTRKEGKYELPTFARMPAKKEHALFLFVHTCNTPSQKEGLAPIKHPSYMIKKRTL